MAYGDNKQQNRSIADVLSDFTKFQHDNLTNERNYNQNVLNNIATIGKYQRDIRTQNMYMRRTNATQRFLEAEQFARTETDESKLPKWLEIMNQARREIGSTKDNESGFEQEGMLRELTMDDLLSMRRMDQMEKKANGEIPTGGKPIADKIKDLGGVASIDNTTKAVTDKDNANTSKIVVVNKSSSISDRLSRMKILRDRLFNSRFYGDTGYNAKNILNVDRVINNLEYLKKEEDANNLDVLNFDDDKLLSYGRMGKGIIMNKKKLRDLDFSYKTKQISPETYLQNKKAIELNTFDLANEIKEASKNGIIDKIGYLFNFSGRY